MGFILFVLFGALLALRHRWIVALHLPAAVYGVLIEVSGAPCPLTFAEIYLRAKAGLAGYEGDFIEQYLLWMIYPDGLTREVQLILGAIVLALNVVIYGWVLRTWRKPGREGRRGILWRRQLR
jgi:hypothetical protein